MTAKKARHPIPKALKQGSDTEMLNLLISDTFCYFLKEWDSETGLVPDKTTPDSPCSMSVNGLALSCYLVAVRRGFMTRSQAAHRTLKMLRTLVKGPQGTEPDAMGYKGFFYHFLDMKTGRRAWESELSTIDTALFIAGALSSAEFFDRTNHQEREIRKLARKLYERIDWKWALNGEKTLAMSWKPNCGFHKARWDSGYNEAMILYALALGSPTHPISPEGYRAWTSTFKWKKIYDIEYIYAGPLFIHQLSHVWIDFRGIFDDHNRKVGINYFENSRRAVFVQRQYAIRNPRGFKEYGENIWGITASDGPGDIVRHVKGRRRKFMGYSARGVPNGPDDGTISPWAVAACLPFTPVLVCDSLRYFIERVRLKGPHSYGFEASFNPTFHVPHGNGHGWISPTNFGLNQGPVILMIENHFSAFIWNLMKQCKPMVRGLKRAGFRGGWLATKSTATATLAPEQAGP